MLNIERGIVATEIVLREMTFKNPSRDMVGTIMKAQAQRLNRLVQAKWQDANGKTMYSATIPPSRFNTPEEIEELSNAVNGATLLTVQEILPL